MRFMNAAGRKKVIYAALTVCVLGFAGWWFAAGSDLDAADALLITMQDSSSGQPFVPFQLTNRWTSSIEYRWMVESKRGAEWPYYPHGTVLPHPGPTRRLEPGESANLVASVPQNGRWRVSVVYCETKSRRERIGELLRACYLDWIAAKVSANEPAYFAYGPERGE